MNTKTKLQKKKVLVVVVQSDDSNIDGITSSDIPEIEEDGYSNELVIFHSTKRDGVSNLGDFCRALLN